MSERIKDGGSAFPVQPCGADGLPESSCEFGMSMRDFFAAKALIGMGTWVPDPDISAGDEPLDYARASVVRRKARWCYEQADAMLAAREVKS